MSRSVQLAIVIALVMSVSIQQAFALKCWSCSSDKVRSQSDFCKDPFDSNNISDREREVSYKECTPTPDQSINHHAYCRKLTQTVKNATLIFRQCYYKPLAAAKEQCYDNSPPVSYIKNEDCMLCDSDGCNGATQYGPTALLFIIPVAVAKIIQL